MSIDWTAFGSIATGLGVIVAVGISVVDHRRDRRAKSLDLLLGFETRFESADFRATRAKAAAFIKAGTPEDDSVGRQSLVDLLNFFETIAFLRRNGLASKEMVWHSLATWLLPYGAAAKPFMNARQIHDPNVFKEFERLYDAVKRVEEKETRYGSIDGLIGASALPAFLDSEILLSLPPGAAT